MLGRIFRFHAIHVASSHMGQDHSARMAIIYMHSEGGLLMAVSQRGPGCEQEILHSMLSLTSPTLTDAIFCNTLVITISSREEIKFRR